MSDYYDRKGCPIPSEEAWRLQADPNYSQVIKTEVDGKLVVSTIWLALDHSFGGATPLIFETMVFPLNDEGEVSWSELHTKRYSSEEDALAGHEQAVEWARDRVGLPPRDRAAT